MTFLPTDTTSNFFANPSLLIGVTVILIVGVTLIVLWIQDRVEATPGVLGIVAVIGAFITFISYLTVLGVGAGKINDANLSSNLRQKYNIDAVLSKEDVRYKDNDLVRVSIDGVHHELWLGQDMGSYEPVLFSGDGKSPLDIKTIEK